MTTGADDPRVRQLGEYIRLQRQMADLSLRGMADLTKVSNAYLSQIERGLHQPSLRVLQAIAEALNIPANSLLAAAGLVPQPPDGDLGSHRDGRGWLDASKRVGEERHCDRLLLLKHRCPKSDAEVS